MDVKAGGDELATTKNSKSSIVKIGFILDIGLESKNERESGAFGYRVGDKEGFAGLSILGQQKSTFGGV